MTLTYKQGDYIIVSQNEIDIQFEIVECSVGFITLLDTLSRIESVRRVVEIDELVVSGRASVKARNIKERLLKKQNAIDFGSYSESLKQQARERYNFVIAVLESKLPSKSVEKLTPIIENTWSNNVFKTINSPPSPRTVQRWVKSYIDSGFSVRSLISANAGKGNRSAKVDDALEPYIQQAIKHFKQLEQPTIAKSYDQLTTLIHYDNILIADPSQKLKLMTYSAFLKRLEKEAPKQLLIARKGKEAANIMYRTYKEVQETTLILQRTEVDHTQLDLFIVDSKQKMVLGRPYITVILDYKSKSILGFYIGFEKPSYMSIARALRHAILPKSYVRQMYKEVEYDWDCYGIPRTLVVDRGKDFESIALVDACMDLNIRIHRNPGKHPWYKGSVESYFKSLNLRLLNDLRGKVFPNIVDSNTYDPKKNAIITMDLFLTIFHKWVIDIYQRDLVAKGTIIPRVSWQEDLEFVPRRVMNKDALDIVLAERTTRQNGPHGIVFEHIRYDSDELMKLRSLTGFRKLEIKYNREDLGYIYVLDDRNSRDKTYFKVPTIMPEYAKGLSRHQHRIILAFNKKYLDGFKEPEALAAAKMKVNYLIGEYLNTQKDNSVATVQNVARYKDIGQQSDQSVTSSVSKQQTDEYSGVPKSKVAIPSPINLDKPDFDGLSNTLPDELDF
ncbi:Mu transposase C-terminal domain-containing protein [Shewanella sp. 5S214]|uniref:Mu transposase C-terminal domain-containing protein n=1 Tax=Shewanella sp. 5S214 TaxID=3229999 RepID=UPI00352EEAD1